MGISKKRSSPPKIPHTDSVNFGTPTQAHSKITFFHRVPAFKPALHDLRTSAFEPKEKKAKIGVPTWTYVWRKALVSLSPCIGVPRCTFLRLRQQMPEKLLPLTWHRIASYRMPFSPCLLAYKNGRMMSKPSQYSSPTPRLLSLSPIFYHDVLHSWRIAASQ